jgi:hypothetical protein
MEPNKIRTKDGYVFERQADGTYTDGDMEWDSLAQIIEAMGEVEVLA